MSDPTLVLLGFAGLAAFFVGSAAPAECSSICHLMVLAEEPHVLASFMGAYVVCCQQVPRYLRLLPNRHRGRRLTSACSGLRLADARHRR